MKLRSQTIKEKEKLKKSNNVPDPDPESEESEDDDADADAEDDADAEEDSDDAEDDAEDDADAEDDPNDPDYNIPQQNFVVVFGQPPTRKRKTCDCKIEETFNPQEQEYWNRLPTDERIKIIEQFKKIKDSNTSDLIPMRFKLIDTDMDMATKNLLLAKIDQFNNMNDTSSEYFKLRNWLSSVSRIPFGKIYPLPIQIDDSIDRCSAFLTETRKKMDNTVYGHVEAKDQIMRIMAQWISNPNSQGHCIGIQGPMGCGKCLAYGTEIIMYNGKIKQVQDIQVGDLIMGDDSTPRTVLTLGRGRDIMYEISNSKGDVYTVNSEHILSLYDTLNTQIIDISVKDYLNLPESEKALLKEYRVSIDFPEIELDIDPYIYGITLLPDSNISDKYIYNSRKNRLKLLEGIVDGTKNFTKNINENISNDIIYLCRSLGFSCYKNKEKFIEMEKKIISTIYIKELPEDNYYGFELDGNGRFILGNFIVTHNTSLVKEGVCKALGLPFGFIGLGGASDGAFLDGHSFTYEGSTYGKISEVLMKTQCMNPVIFFDELDKVSSTHRGDEIIGILTHLTDSSQNEKFNDKYFGEIDLNLSKSLIIFSYNDESRINPILKDRMITICVKGYNPQEKLTIARDYLLPQILQNYNINKNDIIFNDDILQLIITKVKDEEGVRNLKRGIECIISWINMLRYLETDTYKFPFIIKTEHINKYLKKVENNVSLNMMYL